MAEEESGIIIRKRTKTMGCLRSFAAWPPTSSLLAIPWPVKILVVSSGGFHDSFPRISLRRSVHQKELFVRSFVRSFSRVSGSGESFSESFRLTSSLRPSFSFANRECQPSRSDSLPPSAPRSHSRIANASRVVQTHFLPPSLVLVRESRMPAESFRLTSSLVHNIQTNHECTMQFSQLSLGQTPSFSFLKRITKSRFTIVPWCKWLSINTTLTKLI